ncbi:1,3-beta-galactosyl-N-acetylhexosamine phosphorylase, partial [Longicatena caecimuris]|uniref:lacto-N-biose phosphorylase central domain-containing protein n=1 Tax=Longicatena caecimuris TaxID=1796635 RepID=UPI002740B48D
VTILNAWGKVRSWGTHMVAHALWYKEIYSYSGVLEALSGMPLDVSFISFDDILEDPHVLVDAGVIINAGDAYTAYSGGEYWADPRIIEAIRRVV